MRNLVVLGAGTAGTIVVNKLRRRLPASQWRITVVEREDWHIYQPGLLFVPFGATCSRKPVLSLITAGVDVVLGEVHRVDTATRTVLLKDERSLPYDELVIATGMQPRPDQTPGMLGSEWGVSIFDFSTRDGAEALSRALPGFRGGKLVVHISEMPIKCPMAPLEFSFLADTELRRKGIRDKVELTYVTPLSGAFSKPVAALRLERMLQERGITLETGFVVERIDGKTLVSYDERTIPFDLLVTVPVNMGADFLARSGLGDELNCVPVNRHTFVAVGHDNIFALGDAASLPMSKAGSVAHFAAEVFVENFVEHAAGRPMRRRFDGHANCFVEAGQGRALLLDFDYDREPMPGRIGPLPLLRESAVNHWGNVAFRWLYWNVLLPGKRIPMPTRRDRWPSTSIPHRLRRSYNEPGG
ncbi:MAG TPA: FAD/NAD(P)-binding oxidoreductase [Candidatus Limnocylindrales bacterium]|nr:FAD/NAD(P)-binding oxidoreductase [Candidatus Limnocylindrales bacterium]